MIKEKFRSWFFPILGVILLASLLVWAFSRNVTAPLSKSEVPAKVLTVHGRQIHAFVADTSESRQKGLSDRAYLAPDQAMLFVFPEPDRAAIWMKDMHFPLDIVWLDADRRVISLYQRATPDSYPQVFMPTAFASYVIELPAGFISETGLSAGEQIFF